MSESRLEPARPLGEAERPPFAPRFPWKWIAVGLVAVGTVAVLFGVHEAGQEEALRSKVQGTYEQRLKSFAGTYREVRANMERWIVAAGQAEPTGKVDPHLRLTSLHGAQGLYLRMRRDDASSAEAIERGAQAMKHDAVTRCLGIAPASLRGFYDQGQFLMPPWIDRLKSAEGQMRLRLLEEDLAVRMQRDLPSVERMVRSEYLLVLLERGATRLEGPVDVHLWSLPENLEVLSIRASITGTLLPTRIAGAQRTVLPDASKTAGAAADCGIAAQIKAATGEPTMTVGTSTEPR